MACVCTLRPPLVIASFVHRVFAVEAARALNLVVEYGLVEYAEVAAFVALERDVAEDGPGRHILAVAHGAFARGVEVVEIFAVQNDVQSDVPDGEPAPLREDVLVMRIVVVHHHEFRVAALVEVETVLVVSATAAPVKEPGVTACGGDAWVAHACIGVGQLLVGHESLGFHCGNQLGKSFRVACRSERHLVLRFAHGTAVQAIGYTVVADHRHFVLAKHVVGVRLGAALGDHVETAVVERIPLSRDVRESRYRSVAVFTDDDGVVIAYPGFVGCGNQAAVAVLVALAGGCRGVRCFAGADHSWRKFG